VFIDANHNGARDAGESGLAKVRVSNGHDVVLTDGNGRYEIAITDDSIVHVVKPRDYQTSIDALNLPRFYYIHKPAGSPDKDFVFKGVRPTGPLPESIDFPLTAAADPAEFAVVMMGDPQPSNIRQVGYYANDVVADLIGSKVTFGIALGDLVGDDLSLFAPFNEVQATAGFTWYCVHGNHDMNFMAKGDRHADETYEQTYGPADYAFQYGPVHFVILDNVYWKGRQLTASGKPTNANYEGRLVDRQLEFVKNYVQTVPEDERIVLCTHIPLFNPRAKQHGTPQLRQLLEILSSHSHTVSFSGHTHIQEHYFFGPEEGYRAGVEGKPSEHPHHNVATGSGSWFRGRLDERGLPLATMMDGAPNGYIVATFAGTDYRLRYVPASLPRDYQLQIDAPARLALSEVAKTQVLVNVFNGSKKTKTRMRIGGGEWLPMQQTRGVWPPYARLKAEGKSSPGLPNPIHTPHLWQAPLPGSLQAGTHRIEVETTDHFGQTDRAFHILQLHD